MSSPLLALFARSLREDQRQRGTYLARAGLVVLVLLFLVSVQKTFGWGNAPGLHFFSVVAYLNLVFIFLAGVGHFASAITEEKEEATLGLLRMTNLDPLSILLGKSTSRLASALLLLAAQFPFTLLAVALGGVALRQIVAAYLALAAFAIFLANLALLGSVLCRRTTGAATFTFLTLFGLFAGVPFLRWVAMVPVQFGLIATPSTFLGWLNRGADAVAAAAPVGRLQDVLQTGFAGDLLAAQFWSNVGAGAGCFLLAWRLFEACCGEQGDAMQPRSLVARKTSPLRIFGAGRAWPLALAWKDFHFVAGGRGGLLLKLVLYALPPGIVAAVQWQFGDQPTVRVIAPATAWISLLAVNVEAWFIAGSIFRVERQWRTLSSLAVLPIGIPRLAYEKILGTLPALLPGTAFFLGAVVATVVADGPKWPASFFLGKSFLVPLGFVLLYAITFLHLIALLSLHLRRAALPAALAIAAVVLIFGSIGGLFLPENETAFYLVHLTFSLGASTALHLAIGRRLAALAAED